MNTLTWTEENLLSLGKIFLRKVLDNMHGYEIAVVRFGLTGEGIQPNYQVTFPNKNTNPINGVSHRAFKFKEDGFDASVFDPSRLSQPFTLRQIKIAAQI